MATKLAEIGGERRLLDETAAACAAAERLMAAAREAVLPKVMAQGRIDNRLIEEQQLAAHGLAWLKVYVEALKAMAGWAQRLEDAGKLGERETLILKLAFGEYLARIAGGIPMNQVETVRPHDFGLGAREVERFLAERARGLRAISSSLGDKGRWLTKWKDGGLTAAVMGAA